MYERRPWDLVWFLIPAGLAVANGYYAVTDGAWYSWVLTVLLAGVAAMNGVSYLVRRV